MLKRGKVTPMGANTLDYQSSIPLRGSSADGGDEWECVIGDFRGNAEETLGAEVLFDDSNSVGGTCAD